MLRLLPAPSRARPAASKAMAYTTSCACPHTRRGEPSGSMRYTSLPPATPMGAVEGGGAAGGLAAAVPKPTVGVPWLGTAGAMGAGGGGGGGGREQMAGGIENQRPDVLGLGVVEHLRLAVARDAIDLTVGRSSRIYAIVAVHRNGVDLQRVQVGQQLALTVRRDAVQLGAGAAAGI